MVSQVNWIALTDTVSVVGNNIRYVVGGPITKLTTLRGPFQSTNSFGAKTESPCILFLEASSLVFSHESSALPILSPASGDLLS
jgi:hypothetical protein